MYLVILCKKITIKERSFMSFPNLPTDISPTINLPTDQIVNLLLASIAFEELGLAHIINAEAEKIQFVLGTLPNKTACGSTGNAAETTIDDLLKIDKTVDMVLKDVIKKEMLLEFKLETVLGIQTTPNNTESDG